MRYFEKVLAWVKNSTCRVYPPMFEPTEEIDTESLRGFPDTSLCGKDVAKFTKAYDSSVIRRFENESKVRNLMQKIFTSETSFLRQPAEFLKWNKTTKVQDLFTQKCTSKVTQRELKFKLEKMFEARAAEFMEPVAMPRIRKFQISNGCPLPQQKILNKMADQMVSNTLYGFDVMN